MRAGEFPVEHFLYAVPPDERVGITAAALREAELKFECLRRIASATRHGRRRAAAICAAQMQGRAGFSAKSLLNLLSRYTVTGGDWRVVVNKARSPLARAELDLNARQRLEFLDWAHGFLLLNQREKFLPRHRKLMERLALWRATGRHEFAIPGYEVPPANASGQNHPAGWSPSQLRRLCQGSKFEKRAIGVGRQAAAQFRPMVLTTRAKMQIGQVFFFDDNVHDMKVRFLGSQGRVLRPLEFACLDYFSGCFVANLFKPTLWNEEEGKREMLRSTEFIWLLVHWLLDIGWREDVGTTLVSEKGTARVPKWFAEKVAELTRGKVSFDDGSVDRRATCEGFFKGPARGNSRVKSPLESMFGLVRNETSDLLLFPGQVGKERDFSPEELGAREHHEKQLALAELILSRGDTDLLRHDFLEWNQWKKMAFEVYAKINRRGGPGLEWWPHEIEGYVEAGLIANEWRLPLGAPNSDSARSEYSAWLDHSALTRLNGEAAAIRELLHADPVNLTRSRKLSPWEVWQRGSRELSRAPLWWLPLILPLEMARPVTVADDHTIEFSDQTISTDKLHFIARARGQDGCEFILRPGTRYLGFVNQFNPQAIYLTDEKGRGVGECPLHARVDRADKEGVAAANKRVRDFEAAALKPVAKAGAVLAERRNENAAHNAALLQRHCTDGAPLGPVPTREEQDLADMASDVFAANDLPALTHNQPEEL